MLGNLKVAVESGLESLLREEAAAAERAEASWQANAAGRARCGGCRRRPVAIFHRVRSEGRSGPFATGRALS